MNLSDLLYPSNRQRRQDVIDLYQELLDYMKLNFKVTSELIGTMNKHLGAKIPNITMKESGTVKDNCDIIIQAMNSIQQEAQKLDKEMKNRLDPGMYQKLYDIKQPELEKIAIANQIVSIILGEATASAGTAAIKLICSNIVTFTVNKLVALLAQIGISVLGGIAITLFGLGMDVILHAILGAVERDHLLAAIQSYEKHLFEFREASEIYQYAISEICALVKDNTKLI